jgi:hypothetical protein
MRFALAALLVAAPLHVLGQWQPPAKPDPQTIFQEARADRLAGRYDDALAKYSWFFDKAVDVDPKLMYLRRNALLNEWKMLGYRHGASGRKLRETRDLAVARVKQKGLDPKVANAAYLDVAAIGEALDDEAPTRELFLWLDKNDAGLAKEIYQRTQPLLVRNGDIAICGKYIDSKAQFEHLSESYKIGLRYARRSVGGDIDFAQFQFTSEATLLVALLATNNRGADAQLVAAEALKIVDTPGFRDSLKKSLTGEIPDIGPSESARILSKAWERIGSYLGN